MDPYRISQNPINIPSQRTFKGRLRSIYRKALVYYYGRFQDRFARCQGCFILMDKNNYWYHIEHHFHNRTNHLQIYKTYNLPQTITNKNY